MAEKKLGALIKEARTGAGLTQEQLAKKIKGVSASDISAAERGEAVPTQAVLKEIAKITGVTQSSLLNAAKGTAAKKTTAKKTASSAKKTTTASKSQMSVTATEKKLVELYRKADTDKKKEALSILKGEDDDEGILSSLLGSAVELLKKDKK